MVLNKLNLLEQINCQTYDLEKKDNSFKMQQMKTPIHFNMQQFLNPEDNDRMLGI